MDYDPNVISYQELLEIFWTAHNPTSPVFDRQYMNALFYHSEEQMRLATEARDRVAAELGREVETQILPAEQFYLAEDYHQKYNLRRDQAIYAELSTIYPRTEDLITSTAAARINGYMGGYGTRAQLERELDGLGLSPEAGEKLMSQVRR